VAIVVDANVLVVMVSGDPRRDTAQAHIRRWIAAGESIHAPALLSYEVASGLTRLVTGGLLPSDRVGEAWHTVFHLPITYHHLEATGDRVVTVALMMRRQSAYDAAYLVLAQRLQAELWTFDGPLARNAAGIGFAVRLME
jgi:predicted nucleic acid-binding protein